MSTIKVECTDQVLRIMESPAIASGGVNEDYVQFTFCPLWDGFTKTAVFYMDEKSVYHSSLDDEDKCVIPKEAMNEKGKMYFGVFGVNGDIVRTSEVLPYIIKKGAITQGVTPDPTPDIYAQILASVAAAKIKSATINSNGNLIIATQDNQTYDAGKAKGADGKTAVRVTVTKDSNGDYIIDKTFDEIVAALPNVILNEITADGDAFIYSDVRYLTTDSGEKVIYFYDSTRNFFNEHYTLQHWRISQSGNITNVNKEITHTEFYTKAKTDEIVADIKSAIQQYQRLVVTVTKDSNGDYIIDKTFDEIVAALPNVILKETETDGGIIVYSDVRYLTADNGDKVIYFYDSTRRLMEGQYVVQHWCISQSGNITNVTRPYVYSVVPTKTSQLTNDSGYLTLSTLPKYGGAVE